MVTQQLDRPLVRQGDVALWRAILVDLSFWSGAGALVAAASGPASDVSGVPQAWLRGAGVLLLMGGAGLLYLISRMRPVSRRLVWVFAAGNLAAAPLAWLAALLGWFPLSATGNWGLALSGDVMLGLALYQAYALRRHGQGRS